MAASTAFGTNTCACTNTHARTCVSASGSNTILKITYYSLRPHFYFGRNEVSSKITSSCGHTVLLYRCDSSAATLFGAEHLRGAMHHAAYETIHVRMWYSVCQHQDLGRSQLQPNSLPPREGGKKRKKERCAGGLTFCGLLSWHSGHVRSQSVCGLISRKIVC